LIHVRGIGVTTRFRFAAVGSVAAHLKRRVLVFHEGSMLDAEGGQFGVAHLKDDLATVNVNLSIHGVQVNGLGVVDISPFQLIKISKSTNSKESFIFILDAYIVDVAIGLGTA